MLNFFKQHWLISIVMIVLVILLIPMLFYQPLRSLVLAEIGPKNYERCMEAGGQYLGSDLGATVDVCTFKGKVFTLPPFETLNITPLQEGVACDKQTGNYLNGSRLESNVSLCFQKRINQKGYKECANSSDPATCLLTESIQTNTFLCDRLVNNAVERKCIDELLDQNSLQTISSLGEISRISTEKTYYLKDGDSIYFTPNYRDTPIAKVINNSLQTPKSLGKSQALGQDGWTTYKCDNLNTPYHAANEVKANHAPGFPYQFIKSCQISPQEVSVTIMSLQVP